MSENLKGVLWMIVSMGAFSVEDALIKALSRYYPVSEVLVAFGLGGVFVFAILIKRRDGIIFHPEMFSTALFFRAIFELIGRLFYFLAIAFTPLSSATVILQAAPILVVLVGHYYFKEPINLRRWFAVILGLIGVLIIIRPTSSDFSFLSLLAVIGMIGFVGRDLASRAAPKTITVDHLGLYGFLTIAAAGGLYASFDRQPFVVPSAEAAGLFLSAIPVGLLAYVALMNAVRTGEIGVVTPFRYTRLLFGVGLGAFLFGEKLTVPILMGCVVVLLSGLIVAWDNRMRMANSDVSRPSSET